MASWLRRYLQLARAAGWAETFRAGPALAAIESLPSECPGAAFFGFCSPVRIFGSVLTVDSQWPYSDAPRMRAV